MHKTASVFFNFYFEIITDLQEVAKKKKKVPGHPASPLSGSPVVMWYIGNILEQPVSGIMPSALIYALI